MEYSLTGYNQSVCCKRDPAPVRQKSLTLTEILLFPPCDANVAEVDRARTPIRGIIIPVKDVVMSSDAVVEKRVSRRCGK